MQDLLLRDAASVWHPYTHLHFREYLEVIRAEGSFIYTSNGKKIFDGISSWWLITHGHSYEPIIRAVREQAEKFSQVIFAGFTHEPAVRLAESLKAFFPGHYSKVFFSDNGSTAVEVAVKLAVQCLKNKDKNVRPTVLAFKGGYHGDTFGAMSVSGRGVFSDPFRDFLFETEYLDLPTEENISEILTHLDEILARKTVAAFIAEPLIQGAGGMNIYSAEYLDQIVQKIQSEGAFFIADEVMTGFYRTGTAFASDRLKYKPDLMCLSKGLTGGFLPMGATLISEKIVSEFTNDRKDNLFLHGHSFTGNALSIAAALANLEGMQAPDFASKIQKLVDFQGDFCRSLAGLPGVENPRQFGTITAFEASAADAGYLSDLKADFYRFGTENEVLIRPLGNVVYLMPPFGSEVGDLTRAAEVIRAAAIKIGNVC